MNDTENIENVNYIGAEDMIFNVEGGGIQSGGFSVESIMMKAGMSPIQTINDKSNQSGGNVSDLFKNLVIPSWTLSYNNRIGGGKSKMDNLSFDEEDEAIDDELHDKLLGLVEQHNKKLKKQQDKKTKHQQKTKPIRTTRKKTK
tara:strand:- start:1084 stop:1515 length:432 start_codon:yes stop_codon:yes gene_type:complete